MASRTDAGGAGEEHRRCGEHGEEGGHHGRRSMAPDHRAKTTTAGGAGVRGARMRSPHGRETQAERACGRRISPAVRVARQNLFDRGKTSRASRHGRLLRRSCLRISGRSQRPARGRYSVLALSERHKARRVRAAGTCESELGRAAAGAPAHACWGGEDLGGLSRIRYQATRGLKSTASRRSSSDSRIGSAGIRGRGAENAGT